MWGTPERFAHHWIKQVDGLGIQQNVDGVINPDLRGAVDPYNEFRLVSRIDSDKRLGTKMLDAEYRAPNSGVLSLRGL